MPVSSILLATGFAGKIVAGWTSRPLWPSDAGGQSRSPASWVNIRSCEGTSPEVGTQKVQTKLKDDPMQVCLDKSETTGFEHALGKIPDTEFKNLTRSTLPLLCYWRNPERAATSLLHNLFQSSETPLGSVCFEYTVASCGRNKASFTDVMYHSAQTAIGVEGKWTEPMYPSVARWLSLGRRPDNRKNVMRHWIELIRKQTGHVDESKVGAVVYQTLHRAASVCSLGRNRCAIVYQLFHEGESKAKTELYIDALAKLAAAIGAGERLRLGVHEVSMQPGAQYAEIKKKAYDASGRELAGIIREAVLGGGLFTFGRERFVPVTWTQGRGNDSV